MPAVREHQPGGDVVLCDGARTVSLGARGYFQDWEHLLLEHLLHLEHVGSFDSESAPAFVLDALRATTS